MSLILNSENNTWKCASCGAENDEQFKFCLQCGSPKVKPAEVPKNTWNCCFCGAENDDKYKFCLQCGNPKDKPVEQPKPAVVVQPAIKKRLWKCTSCGAENVDENKFCGQCGAKRPELSEEAKSIISDLEKRIDELEIDKTNASDVLRKTLTDEFGIKERKYLNDIEQLNVQLAAFADTKEKLASEVKNKEVLMERNILLCTEKEALQKEIDELKSLASTNTANEGEFEKKFADYDMQLANVVKDKEVLMERNILLCTEKESLQKEIEELKSLVSVNTSNAGELEKKFADYDQKLAEADNLKKSLQNSVEQLNAKCAEYEDQITSVSKEKEDLLKQIEEMNKKPEPVKEEVKATKFCRFCGKKIDADATVCPECKKKL